MVRIFRYSRRDGLIDLLVTDINQSVVLQWLTQWFLRLHPRGASTICLAGGLQPCPRLSPEEAAHQDFCFCLQTAISTLCPLHKSWCFADGFGEKKYQKTISINGWRPAKGAKRLIQHWSDWEKKIVLTQKKKDFLKIANTSSDCVVYSVDGPALHDSLKNLRELVRMRKISKYRDTMNWEERSTRDRGMHGISHRYY